MHRSHQDLLANQRKMGVTRSILLASGYKITPGPGCGLNRGVYRGGAAASKGVRPFRQ
jgi:hypothetical protein